MSSQTFRGASSHTFEHVSTSVKGRALAQPTAFFQDWRSAYICGIDADAITVEILFGGACRGRRILDRALLEAGGVNVLLNEGLAARVAGTGERDYVVTEVRPAFAAPGELFPPLNSYVPGCFKYQDEG